MNSIKHILYNLRSNFIYIALIISAILYFFPNLIIWSTEFPEILKYPIAKKITIFVKWLIE